MPNIKDLSNLQLQRYEELLKNVVVTEKELAKEYLIALKTIRSDLLDLVDDVGNLSYAQAAQFNRLLSLEKAIENTLNGLVKENVRSVNSLLATNYESTYYSYGWAIDQHLQVRLDWGLLKNDVVQRSIDNPYAKVAWDKYKTASLRNVKTVINQGIIQGKSIQDITKDLKSALNTGYNKAVRIARTEVHKVMEQASQDQFEYSKNELKIDLRKKLVATLDDRTRPQSAQMDGAISNEQGEFLYPDGQWHIPGNTDVAEWDINDRERSVEFIEDYGPIVRRSREDGIIPYQDYKTWAKDKGITHNIYGEKLF